MIPWASPMRFYSRISFLMHFFPLRVGCLNLGTRGRGGDSFTVALGPPLSWSCCGGAGGLSSTSFMKLFSVGWVGTPEAYSAASTIFGKAVWHLLCVIIQPKKGALWGDVMLWPSGDGGSPCCAVYLRDLRRRPSHQHP